MENQVNALKVRRHFWKVQKVEDIDFEFSLAGMLG
jgi:hypothetical protein